MFIFEINLKANTIIYKEGILNIIQKKIKMN